MSQTELPKGKIVRIIGVVVDVYFADHIPDQYSALKVANVVLEVQSHLGNNVVRCISMTTTDGLFCGQEVVDTMHPISVPVGKVTLGRVFNVTGDLIDGGARSQSMRKKDQFMQFRRDSPNRAEKLNFWKQVLK